MLPKATKFCAGLLVWGLVKCPSQLGWLSVFTHTRVPVNNLFDYLKAGDTLEEFLHDFPSVKKEQVVELLAFL